MSTAEILNMDWLVESKHREHVRIDVHIPNGYEAPDFLAFYEKISERSVLGILLQSLIKLLGKKYETVVQALDALKNYGHIYVKVSGFRERALRNVQVMSVLEN